MFRLVHSVGYMICLIGQILTWLLTWLYYVLIICLAGALLGLSSHLAYGFFIADSPDLGYLGAFGFLNGLRYGGVWAGGLSIVLCVMRARKEYLQKHRKSVESEV